MGKFLLPLIAGLLSVACSDKVGNATMADLERTLDRHHEYVERFEHELDSVKKAVPADASDSLLWEHAYEMYEVYRYYNIDTVKRYVREMEKLVRGSRIDDKDQCSLTEGARIRYMRSVTADLVPVVDRFEKMDTSGLRKSTVRKWYSVGVTLYMAALENSKNQAIVKQYKARLDQLAREYEEKFFDYSVHCRIMTAVHCRDNGNYERARQILTEERNNENLTLHEQTQVTYYLSTVYDRLGMYDKYKELLILTAGTELQIPVRDYHSLYELALLLYRENDIMRATKFIALTYSDALAINYYSRLRRASLAQNIIAKSAYETERQRIRIMTCFLVLSGVALILVSILLVYSFRQRGRLRRSYMIVASMKDKQEKINGELRNANKIKDNYVQRYMQLSTYYIRQVDETRKEIKRAAKTGGLDEVMAILRSPRYADEEYKRFYRIFDETFVGLFPNFVEKVNELFPEEYRFDRTKKEGLNTELRILAVIRLGIVKSPEISEVLNCSINTVYKYRESMRQRALCQKDEFEKLVSCIDF